MSSLYVRQQFTGFLAAEIPSEKVLDLTSLYGELKDALGDAGIPPRTPWIGIEFIGNDEVPITIGSTNTAGKYRETGAVYVHVVDIAKLGGSSSILLRAEALRDLFRGRRLGRVLVDSVTPPNFDSGATLNFEGGYMSASILIGYDCDVDL